MGNAYHSIGEYQKAINCHKKKHLEIVDGLGTKKVELEELVKIWETIITVFVDTKKQLSATVNIWKLRKNWKTKL